MDVIVLVEAGSMSTLLAFRATDVDARSFSVMVISERAAVRRRKWVQDQARRLKKLPNKPMIKQTDPPTMSHMVRSVN